MARRTFFNKRVVRWPTAMAAGGLCVYLFTLVFLKEIYKQDLHELELTKYFELDLNADMMKQDLK